MAGKIVGDFDSAEAFIVENVQGGWERLRVVEGADVKVDLSGEVVRLIGERSAAGRAKAAFDALRGSEHDPLALREGYRGRSRADEQRDRRARAAPASRAVAIAGPEW